MSKRIRQYLGLLSAVLLYFIVHEGAHALYALSVGAFKQVNFLGVGVQVDIYRDRMTDTQLGIFCLVGAVSTFIVGWLLVLLCQRICALRPMFPRTLGWYLTLILLLLDPLYLSILYSFVGGGDMNGIVLICPEWPARIAFGLLGILHLVVIARYVYPAYKHSFATAAD